MSAPLLASFLRAQDDIWKQCPQVVELYSASFDADVTGIGSSPFGADLGSTGVRVPDAPTISQRSRYLFRLCGVEIPNQYAIIIKGLRQAATIRHTEIDNGRPLILEREIVSPFWRFLDGNISWHLMLQQQQFAANVFDPAQTAGTSPEEQGLDTVLLYNPPLVPYTPPGAGYPPGNGIEDLGTIRDIRFRWDRTSWTMHTIVRGPGAVVFYASVFQTNPANRPQYPSVDGMRPEDKFLSNFPDARYGRVMGAMTFQVVEMERKK